MAHDDQGRTYADFLRILRRSTDLLNEDPVREEIFSVERLEQYALYLADELKVSAEHVKGRSLISSLKESGRKLLYAYHSLTEAIRSKQAVSPAAEWFVDNFHIVEDQLREIKQDLPVNYYKELPRLAGGELKGYPRVYAIALAIIAHTDSRLDAEALKRFIIAYQQVAPLRIGEIWAVAITLRIALVEHLQPLAFRIVSARQKREEANLLADRLLALAAQPSSRPDDLIQLMSTELGDAKNFDRAFIVQLIQRLRDQDPDVWPAFDWLETQLNAFNTNTQLVTQLEHHMQATAQVTVGNIISSMRLLSSLDWRDFFEGVSLIDPILALDPADAYSQMDFTTRDRYRHAIERVARRSKTNELDVARVAVRLAREANPALPDGARKRHVGYYLVGDGRRYFEAQFKYRPRLSEYFSRWIEVHPAKFFLFSLLTLTLILLAPALKYFSDFNRPLWQIICFGLLAVFPAGEFALSIFNHYITFLVRPRPLAKMDTEKGISEDARTMVVIPTLITSEAGIQELLELLQVHYLANKDPFIYFALLTDFADASTQTTERDAALLASTRDGIESLNRKYAGQSENRFYLFHRQRLWNSSENKWIGWERKRGKLHEFNRLLRGARNTSYVVATGDERFLAKIKYVITLDSDTQLPRDSAHKLIGTIIHPLNRPYIDPAQGRVTAGYGILQPRVSVSLLSSTRSRFAQIFSGNTGLDPYTTAVSDVYQDLFDEGSFTGKGLYVVDAFESALDGRVPENYLLSHDLFEGSYARSALVTDVEFFDDYPADYDTYAKRMHRWTRGDWQIAQWLLPFVPNAQRKSIKNNLTLISKWKIFDNLRRSLVPVAVLLWLALAWTLLPGSPFLWTLLIVIMLIFPVLAPATQSLFQHRRGVPWQGQVRNLWATVRMQSGQILLTVAFLAQQSWVQSDAIARTFYRKFISKQKLLEWTTFAQIQNQKKERQNLFETIGPAPAIALVLLVAIVALHGSALWVAAPFLLSWFLNPWLKKWTESRPRSTDVVLNDLDLTSYRSYARRTWHFFETFVGPEDNWLAPDNFQEDPKPVIAHRTSPTNMGLQLLATASAYDLGYLGLLDYIERLEKTFVTLSKLPKQHGHFFNWYDTLTLEPLRPQYISTVDSGNLAGHLLTLKQACVEIGHYSVVNPQARAALLDTLAQLRIEIYRAEHAGPASGAFTLVQLTDAVEALYAYVQNSLWANLFDWQKFLHALRAQLVETEDILNALASESTPETFAETRIWMTATHRMVNEFYRDLQVLTPWVFLGEEIFQSARVGAPDDQQSEWTQVQKLLSEFPTLSQYPQLLRAAQQKYEAHESKLNERLAHENRSKTLTTVADVLKSVQNAATVVAGLFVRQEALIHKCDELAMAMDFRFLFDEQRKIFVIGYNVADGRRDNSYYDLLASESRLTSFVAIAKGEVPQEHWFRLGRAMTPVSGGRALISWTATMFEYLMPLLVMRRYADTLLEQTYKSVVRRQIEYGRQRGVPWGISEAGYNARDLQLNYQYGPFGIPGLGLRRGLSDDLVVSPYSTMLAAMIDPLAAIENLRGFEKKGIFARFGFYESVDYTAERLQKKQKSFILRSFMAHHQGMSLVAINNLLNANIMQRRFHAEPIVQATQLLLQERIPHEVALTRPRAEEVRTEHFLHFATNPNPRYYSDVSLPTPRTQLLSNGNYSVMVTSAGSGYSRCGRLAVSRWREDVTRDHWGHFFYIRNRKTGKLWSTAYQPTTTLPKSYDVTFAEDKVEFWRQDGDINTHTEIIVSPEDDVELRRISLTNNSDEDCELEVTSFMEAVLAPPADDAAHPAFSNLFVQTEFVSGENALLATRRRRSQSEAQVWGFHVVVTEGNTVGSIQYETDRARFLGRGHSATNPSVVLEDRPLSNSVGSVLDPIFSLRQTIKIPPGETMRLTFTTGVTHSREDALRLTDKYHDIYIFTRETELAWTKSQVQLRHLNINPDKAHTFQRLAGRVIFSDPSLRPRHVIMQNTKAQSSLWAYGIGGDLPIVLTRISDEKDMAMVRELLHGHEYLRLKGLAIDLVILNERSPSYIQVLQEELQKQIRMSGSQALIDKPGGVFIRRSDIMPKEDIVLLRTVARVSLSAEKGTLDEQLKRRPVEYVLPERFLPSAAKVNYPVVLPTFPELSFFNGLGGFSAGGRSYVIVLKAGQWTPAPWINVIANEHDFGFIISESGSGYTWSANSRENRLTSWSNDSVSDPVSEALYIRDEESGYFWSPTPLPIRETETYIIKHAQGFSQFDHISNGIAQELQVFVPLDGKVKISRLRLKNLGTETRKLSVTSFAEWVLGFQRGASAPYVITEVDELGTVFARNLYNNEFASRVAFADISESERSFTCDRKEFLGRNGSPAKPAALLRRTLSGLSGAGLDPCAAFQTHFELAPGEEREVVVLLGQGDNLAEAQALVQRFKDKAVVRAAFKQVVTYWEETLGTIEVKTPDLALNTIMNRWLLYQTLACRVWARSAFYQSGGAYGFRDQLQDVMALVYAKPHIAREQILRAAARQFPEGDVQHWWHPPTGRGVRTRFSDDLLWLPYVTSFYINVTGDRSILNESVAFIEAPMLEVGHDDAYTHPQTSTQSATVLEHCLRTIDKSLVVGRHGLPLMGSGDWNDGMSRVGNEGRGESVWVGWFLYKTIKDFLPFCEPASGEDNSNLEKTNTDRITQYRNHMVALQKAIEENAWDGDWYRRAYFDDGTPLGAAANEECRIDSIAQSWAVLSGAGDAQRAVRAMGAVDEYLVHRGDGLVKLFTPPFDKTSMDPGYIKGYVPGVRENGGQYTHAAIWTLMAYAALGDGERASELYSLLNPINHASTRAGLHKYKVEPYVAAADIYALWPHVGRGGWTWYTGSASWMYRAALESILGFELRGDVLRLKPCIPKLWPEFEISYRHRSSRYKIVVINNQGEDKERAMQIEVDGVSLTTTDILLQDDGASHFVQIRL